MNGVDLNIPVNILSQNKHAKREKKAIEVPERDHSLGKKGIKNGGGRRNKNITKKKESFIKRDK